MVLIRRCTHHRIPSWEFIKTFYRGLNDHERNMVVTTSGGTLVEIYADDSMKFRERLVEIWDYQQIFSNSGRNTMLKLGSLINVTEIELENQMDRF